MHRLKVLHIGISRNPKNAFRRCYKWYIKSNIFLWKYFLIHIKEGLPHVIHFSTPSPPILPYRIVYSFCMKWFWITSFSADLISSCVLLNFWYHRSSSIVLFLIKCFFNFIEKPKEHFCLENFLKFYNWPGERHI